VTGLPQAKCSSLPAIRAFSLTASRVTSDRSAAVGAGSSKAGEHQVPGARTALGHAYGGGSQFFSMWVVADTPG
jgi:hypothetical protein